MSNFVQVHSLYIAPIHSVVINDYLNDSGGYLCMTNSLNINCSWVGCFPEKSRGCLIEQVCQGSIVYSALNNPEVWILRYIK